MRADVLHLRSSAGLYGADQMVLALVSALPAAGVAARLLTIENYRLDTQPLHAAATSRRLDCSLLPCRSRFDRATLAALRAEIAASPDALLHVHDYKSAFYAWLATRGTETRVVATLHGWVETSRALKLYMRIELTLLRRFERLVIVADAQRAVLARAGIAASRVVTIANGVDAQRFSPSATPIVRGDLGVPPNAFLFGTVARLAPEKNIGALIDALGVCTNRSANAALAIVGDGPDRDALVERARAVGVADRVAFVGVRADTERFYAAFDAFVLPSLTEGMPLAVLEAMACAKPVIASSVGEIPTLLAECERGRLVPPGDVDALAAALESAMRDPGNDPPARRSVEAHYSLPAMATRYAALYRDIREARDGRAVA